MPNNTRNAPPLKWGSSWALQNAIRYISVLVKQCLQALCNPMIDFSHQEDDLAIRPEVQLVCRRLHTHFVGPRSPFYYSENQHCLCKTKRYRTRKNQADSNFEIDRLRDNNRTICGLISIAGADKSRELPSVRPNMNHQEINNQRDKCGGWPYFYEAKKGAFHRENYGADKT
jgi:hypothetical protein